MKSLMRCVPVAFAYCRFRLGRWAKSEAAARFAVFVAVLDASVLPAAEAAFLPVTLRFPTCASADAAARLALFGALREATVFPADDAARLPVLLFADISQSSLLMRQSSAALLRRSVRELSDEIGAVSRDVSVAVRPTAEIASLRRVSNDQRRIFIWPR